MWAKGLFWNFSSLILTYFNNIPPFTFLSCGIMNIGK
jgi:hypothetical protein